jgi:Fe2+ transport system protein FeoA
MHAFRRSVPVPQSRPPCAPTVPAAAVRLSEVPVGFTGHLHEMHVDEESRSLLRALGLTDASVLRVCKQGEPCVVQVQATRIGISSRIARDVFVIAAEIAVTGDASCR